MLGRPARLPFGQVNIERIHGVVMVDAYIPNEVSLTAAQAREMGAALLKTADIVEAPGRARS